MRVISLRNLSKTFSTPAGTFRALRGVSLEVAAGEFVAIVGRSGSGKSTLLNLIAGLDPPTTGSVTVGGRALHELRREQLAGWRGRQVGIVFQFFQLLPTLTAAENVMLPMDFCNTWPARERRARAQSLLAGVGVADQADKLPATLSGGQQQRVAIARALANDPPLLLADEPTGNLDSATSAEVFGLLGSLAAAGRTVLVVTHERDTFTGVGRTLTLVDGAVAP
jgi:putative ABC transport system ATP-binding protein